MTQPPHESSARYNEKTVNTFVPRLCSMNTLLLLVLAAELLALLLSVAQVGLRQLSWAHLGLVSFLVQWVALASAAAICALRPLLARLRPLWAGGVCYALILLITGVFAMLGQWLLNDVGRGFFDWWQVADYLLMAAVVAGLLLRYLFLQQQLHLQQQAELQARIQVLQARIEPHFLFNSMNSIASLIAVDPDKAERLVEDLSDLFRASLSDNPRVPITQELDLCRAYARIEQLRLGERLRLSWQVDPLPAAVSLPSLLLQPLLENAIYHGVEPSATGGDISVSVSSDDKQLTLSVANSLAGQAGAPRTGHHMALINIRHRLSAHFGERAKLVTERHNGEFVARIGIAKSAFSHTHNNSEHS